MKLMGLLTKSCHEEQNISESKICRVLNHEIDFYNEFFFQKMVIRERKRSERTERSFLMIVVNLERLPEGREKQKIIHKLVKAIGYATREEDIKGWYNHNRKIGILFTELKPEFKKIIMDRLNKTILQSLDEYHASLIDFEEILFPMDKNIQPSIKVYTDLYSHNPQRKPRFRMQLFLKRIIDILGSSFALLIFSPCFIIIPIFIKLTSKGPVLFKQKRVGQFSKPFTLLKFRSMRVNASNTIHKNYMKNFIQGTGSGSNNKGSVTTKMKNDPRITPIGKFLRKSSLDELPQLINVLKGEMSLVGPRPAIPYEVEEYNIWHKRRVFEMKPGLTGLWQVEGRSKVSFDGMVRMDIKYLQSWSPLMDILLILRTPMVLLTARGAY